MTIPEEVLFGSVRSLSEALRARTLSPADKYGERSPGVWAV